MVSSLTDHCPLMSPVICCVITPLALCFSVSLMSLIISRDQERDCERDCGTVMTQRNSFSVPLGAH